MGWIHTGAVGSRKASHAYQQSGRKERNSSSLFQSSVHSDMLKGRGRTQGKWILAISKRKKRGTGKKSTKVRRSPNKKSKANYSIYARPNNDGSISADISTFSQRRRRRCRLVLPSIFFSLLLPACLVVVAEKAAVASSFDVMIAPTESFHSNLTKNRPS